MAKNDIITIYAFGEEIGKVGYDLDQRRSSFQYHPDFLNRGRYTNLFPNIIRRIPQAQVFRSFENENFRGLPPMIADSLPDMFGNTIFKVWMDSKGLDFGQISIIEQLAYVSNRYLHHTTIHLSIKKKYVYTLDRIDENNCIFPMLVYSR